MSLCGRCAAFLLGGQMCKSTVAAARRSVGTSVQEAGVPALRYSRAHTKVFKNVEINKCLFSLVFVL